MMSGAFSSLLLASSTALLAASGPLWFCFRLRNELQRFTVKETTEQLLQKNDLLTEQLCALTSRVESLEQSKADHTQWVAQAESVNLNRRGQVLRLHRRGESVADIASALRVGQGEVKLMLKIHEICRERPAFVHKSLTAVEQK